MAQYDGAIRIVTKITTKDAQESLASLEWQIKKSAKYMDELRSKMDALKDQKIPTEKYKDLQKEISDTEKEFAQLLEAKKKLEVSGLELPRDSEISRQLGRTEEKIYNLKSELESLEQSGKGFTLGKDTAEYAAYARQLQYEEEAIAKAGEHYKTLESNEKQLSEIKEKSTVSDQKMVDLLEERSKLASKLMELESAGVTEGYKEYDEAYIAWKNAADAVKAYRAELDKQTESGRARTAEQEAKELEKKEAIQRRIEEQAEKNLQKENARIQREAEAEAKLQAREAERQEKLRAEAAEEERLAQIRESAVVGNQRIVEAMERRKQLIAEIKDMEAAGVGAGYQQHDLAVQELAAVEQEIRDYNNGIDEAKENYSKLGAAAKKAFSILRSSVEKSSSGLKRFGGFAKNAFSSLDRSTKKSSSLLGTLGSRFKGLALSLLIFNQISKAFNAMISGTKEGFGNLYKEVNGFKNSVNSLKASILTLKNSFAAAFRPLVETAIPYIQKTVDAMANLLDTIGQFTAAITGQKTYTKAVRQTVDAIEDENKASKKQLGSLDKLNNLTSDSGAGSGDSADKMFEENVPIQSGITDAADQIKEIFSKIFDTLKEAWDKKGKKVVNSAKKALGSLAKMAESVGTTFYETFTGEVGLEWVESMLGLFESILGTIESISEAFSNAWDGGAGEENVKALFGMLTDINGLLTSIGDSFSKAFSGEIGTAIFENILGIFTGIYTTIGNIATAIQTAWDTAGNGDRIINGILELVNTILRTIHNIVDSTAEWALNLDFTLLLESIGELLESLQPLAENIGAGLQWFWDNVLLPVAGWVIEDAVPVFLDMLSTAIDTLNAIIDALKPAFQWFWDEFLEPLAEWTGELIITAMKKITKLLKKFGDWVTEHKEEISEFIEIVGLLAIGFIAVQAAVGLVTGVLPALVSGIGGVIAVLTGPLGIIAALGLLVVATGHGKELIDGLKGVLKGLVDFVAGVFTGNWKRAWNGIKEIFEGVGKSIKAVLDSIVDGIEWVLKKLGIMQDETQKTKKELPDIWKTGQTPAVSTGGGFVFRSAGIQGLPGIVDLPNIPGYATGQVIPRGMQQHLAILGDNNRETEVVSPLSTIEQALENVMRRNGGIGGGKITIEIPLIVDGRELTRVVQTYDQEHFDRTGKGLFAY